MRSVVLVLILGILAAESRLLPLSRAPDDLDCGIESGSKPYSSLYNLTSLKKCTGPTSRAEKVCIVGGGSSGIHLGWLLKRRGFNKTVVFERNDRIGGDVWTLKHGTHNANVTRELGAAFLSPDYDEVRALLQRYGLPEQPISVKDMMRFHVRNTLSNGTVVDHAELPTKWYGDWVATVTGIREPEAQGKAVGAALER